MAIKIFNSVSELQSFLTEKTKNGAKIGFVPTMGALHNGHISLIEQSNQLCDLSICSIFVNPTQFDNKKDLDKYPSTIKEDVSLLEQNHCDAVFIPDVDEVYPKGTEIEEKYDFGFITSIGEGQHRKGHFDGVAQVVGRLLDIVMPDHIFMGQKDYQQAMIIKKLVKFKKIKTEVVVCKIIREKDGLAMSSRNRRLSKEERQIATVLFETETFIKKNLKFYKIGDLMAIAEQMLNKKKYCKLEYIDLRDASTLAKIEDINDPKKMVILTSCYVGEIRLIDNMEIEPDNWKV